MNLTKNTAASARSLVKFAINWAKIERQISTTQYLQSQTKIHQSADVLAQQKVNSGGTSARQRVIILFGAQNKLKDLDTAIIYEDLTSTKDEKNKWKGILKLTWPFPIELEIIGQSKKIVTNSLYETFADMLQKKGYFDKKRSADVQTSKISTSLQLTDESRIKLKSLLNSFQELKENLKEIIENRRKTLLSSTTIEEESEKTEEKNVFSDVITGHPLKQMNLIGQDLELRNFALFSHWVNLKNNLRPNIRQLLKDRQSLPIYSVKQEFLDALDSSRVVLLKGDTGCGKTTQIPQIIFENFVQQMNGASCNIVVTQPRRLSAISVAGRISKERNEPIGSTVGYRVRLKQMSPHGNGSILFTTPGMLLRSRFKNPNFEGVSHVIVDEIHERDIWTDFLLISLKHAMKINENLKLILMSATFGVEKFQKYFSNCPVVETLGRKFDVDEFFLEDIHKNLSRHSSSIAPVKTLPVEPDGRLPTDVKICVDTIEYIHKNHMPGAILCFLPTTGDIRDVHKNISERSDLAQEVLVLHCHSKLPIDEQENVFSTPPNGIRKIILATNIAETSITINDVRYVVNSGTHKSHVFDRDSESMRAVEVYACRAAQIQRKGRAGRVAEGSCYHLFPKTLWETLDENFVPELLREQLSNVVLLAKAFSPDEDPAEFLADAVDPPNPYQIENAVEELTEMKFLDQNRNLTPIGRRLCKIGCSPMLAKAMLYGVVLKCLDPVLSIVSILESRQNLFTRSFHETDKTIQLKTIQRLMGLSYSDYILFYKLFEIYRNEFKFDDETKLDENYFNKNSFQTVENLRRLFARSIVKSGLCENDTDILNLEHDLNSLRNNEVLIKCAMASGSHQNLLKRIVTTNPNSNRSKSHFVDQFRRPVYNFSSSAVHSMIKNDQTNSIGHWFNCMGKVLDVEGYSYKVEGLSNLNPMAAILFSGFNLTDSNKNSLSIELQPSVNFSFIFENKNDKNDIFDLRELIEESVEWHCLKVIEEIRNTDNEIKFTELHKNLLETLICLLNDGSTNLNK